MSTIAESMRAGKAPWTWVVSGLVLTLLIVAAALPNLHQLNISADRTRALTQSQVLEGYANPGLTTKSKSVLRMEPTEQSADVATPKVSTALLDAAAGRKIIRTTSLDLIVQHPAETMNSITALAESLGGYLVSAEGGGQNAAHATLSIRVPASRFDEARSEIRNLGVRVEAERIEAQDVTRQYVDEDANVRNLRAEEAQYLSILKQASTVKDMLAVSQRLSEVRGQIEQQQAEFNALSQQIETVAIAISLRTEVEEQVLGLNWRPLYQLKLALHDGLESIGTYAMAMTTILFYLPAALLWVGTLTFSLVAGWKTLGWIGKRWFGWGTADASAK